MDDRQKMRIGEDENFREKHGEVKKEGQEKQLFGETVDETKWWKKKLVEEDKIINQLLSFDYRQLVTSNSGFIDCLSCD